MGLATETAIQAVLEAEQNEGRLDNDLCVSTLTTFILSVAYGLSIMAQRGKSADELTAVIEMAVASVPIPDSHTLSH